MLGLLTISDGELYIVYAVFRDNRYPLLYIIFTIYKLKFGMGFKKLRGYVICYHDV